MQKQDGFFPIYHEAKTGKLFLLIDKFNTEFLYYESLPAGLGSNDTGLDRGLLGQEKVVHFERVGPKVLLVQENLDYRATSSDPAERQSVADSFARSIIAGFTVEAEEEGKALIDVTSFVVRDAMNVAGRLRQQNQGTFRLDPARSAIYMPRTKAFPKNTELEATITFAGENVGNFVSSVTPTPDSMTLRVHHSFLELPPPGFKPRAFDPRSGYNQLRYMDYATPVEQPINKRFITRHRLEKKDPTAKVSEAVKPLIYYVDRGAPSRSAPPCLKARAGGIRPLRPSATRTPSASRSCLKAPTRWMPATTSSSGSTVPPAAGAMAPASPTRAPARSSRATSRSAACVSGKTS